MTVDEARKILALVAARYPNAKMLEQDTKLTAQAWHMSLEDVPYQAAQQFLVTWFRTEKWAPDPSEIRLAVGADLLGLPAVEEAWGMVLRAASAFDSSDLPQAMKVAIRAVGGLYAVKHHDRPDMLRIPFIEAYTFERKDALEHADLTQLSGGGDEPQLRAIS